MKGTPLSLAPRTTRAASGNARYRGPSQHRRTFSCQRSTDEVAALAMATVGVGWFRRNAFDCRLTEQHPLSPHHVCMHALPTRQYPAPPPAANRQLPPIAVIRHAGQQQPFSSPLPSPPATSTVPSAAAADLLAFSSSWSFARLTNASYTLSPVSGAESARASQYNTRQQPNSMLGERECARAGSSRCYGRASESKSARWRAGGSVRRDDALAEHS